MKWLLKSSWRALLAGCLLWPALALAADPIWIDVRTPEEYSAGHLQVAVNVPYTEIGERIGEVTQDKDAFIYLYCRSGRRSGIAKETLEAMGYTNVTNVGGYEEARAAAAGTCELGTC